MNPLTFFIFSIILLSGNLSADIILGAPGVPAGSRIATKVPFQIDYILQNSYKFIFSGIQAKGDTLGAPGCSGTMGNGGQFQLQATASSVGSNSRAGLITFRNVEDFNTSPLTTLLVSPPAVFKATTTPININLRWKGNGNAHKPNGIFNILGEFQKDPPVPTGSLSLNSDGWVLANSANLQGTVTIIRE